MNKEVTFKTLDELLKTLELKEKYPSKKLEKILMRNYILSLYTIWETYAKNKVFDSYSDYEYILHTEEFIKRYLKKSFGKTFLSKEFLKDLTDTKVKKEILCQSNNLNWGKFQELLLLIGLNTNKLNECIDDSAKINKIVDLLKDSGLIPIHANISTGISESVSGYIQLIVNLRNTISHTYKMEIDEHLSTKQMTLLIHLFKCTINLIEEYIEKEICEIYKEKPDLIPVISVIDVHKGCNASGNQEAILMIKVTDCTIDLNVKKLLIKSTTNKGYCEITGIKRKGLDSRNIPLDENCTIKVTSSIQIRKGLQYELFLPPHKSQGTMNIIQYV